jgi:phosphotransferase system IIA component
MENEIKELEIELDDLKDELEIIMGMFTKGMDGKRFKVLMAQKNEVEKFIAEVQVELEILKSKQSKS